MNNRRQAIISLLKIAELCHEANRAICESVGDTSQTSWDNAPQWQRESAVEGVLTVLETPEITPEDLHFAWAQAKREDGWTYGTTKDVTAKTHPCLVPYSELPTEQQTKDFVFRAIVMTLSREVETVS